MSKGLTFNPVWTPNNPEFHVKPHDVKVGAKTEGFDPIWTPETPKTAFASKTAAFSFGAILLAALAYFGYKTHSEKQAKDGKSLTNRVTDAAKQAAQTTNRLVKKYPVQTRVAIAVAAAGVGFLGYKLFPKATLPAKEYNPDHACKLNTDDSQAYEATSRLNSNYGDQISKPDFAHGVAPGHILTSDPHVNPDTGQSKYDFPNIDGPGMWEQWASEASPVMPSGKMPSKVSTRGAWQEALAEHNESLAVSSKIRSLTEDVDNIEPGPQPWTEQIGDFMNSLKRFSGYNSHVHASNHESVSVDERDTVFRFPPDEDSTEVGMA